MSRPLPWNGSKEKLRIEAEERKEKLRIEADKLKMEEEAKTEERKERLCGGRVVILLYCPPCFLMETALYWYLRQISLRADVDWALLLFSTV